MSMLKISTYPDEGIVLTMDSFDSFTLTYDVSWDSIPIYGRQDPIQSYKSTGQTVNFSVPFMPAKFGEKDPDDDTIIRHETMDWLVKSLNKMLRQIYNNGIINQSPLLRVEIGAADNPFYGTSGFILAPSSVSMDYGDRGRLIQQETHVGGSYPGIPFAPIGLSVIPQKILVTFSGAIINIETVYRPASTASPTNPSTTNATPALQADANTANIISGNPILKNWKPPKTP